MSAFEKIGLVAGLIAILVFGYLAFTCGFIIGMLYIGSLSALTAISAFKLQDEEDKKKGGSND